MRKPTLGRGAGDEETNIAHPHNEQATAVLPKVECCFRHRCHVYMIITMPPHDILLPCVHDHNHAFVL
jgi:hypothetical protein